MTVIALLFCLVIFAFGVMGLLSPVRTVRLAKYFQTQNGIYFAAGVRVVMGLVLFFAAPDSRAPDVLRILGVVVMVAGVGTLFVGLDRFRRLVDWWSAQTALIRAQGALALVIGLLLAFTLVP